jgi:cytochrome c peroxidase
MGKAACGTCHFAPTFNGTVPPGYSESESEVLGVPSVNTTDNPPIDPDLGRLGNRHPRDEAEIYRHSFKTVTVRNVTLTAPYMHNGVYNTLEEVVDFYNRGGGAGMGMDLPFQTLPFSELNLNEGEVADLVAFMETLTDTTGMTKMPAVLPKFEDNEEWNTRKIGGEY